MGSFISTSKDKFDQAIAFLKEELATLRVGRANPIIVENIVVDTYGSKMTIKQIASISVPEVRTLLIQPWDKTIMKDIEKAIINAAIGIAPVNEGQQIRLTVPQLTEESRKELTKSVAEKAEKSRVAIRQLREKFKEDIIKKERNKEITEDDRYDLVKELDDIVKEYNTKIEEIAENKTNEIMKL